MMEEGGSDDVSTVCSDVTYNDDKVWEDDEFHDIGGSDTSSDFSVYFAIKNNSSYVTKLTIYPYNPTPTLQGWISLGRDIGRNTYLKCLTSSADVLDEDDEIATPENLESFFTCLSNNRSLTHLFLELYDFSRARLEVLHPFVIENQNLIYLQLHECGFDLRAIQLLANAFRQRRNPKSIKVINMGGANIIDEMVTPIIEICSSCPGLQVLDMSYSRIGNQGCNLLANMLEHPGCKLKQLDLQGITIDDEAARILASSLANNNKLKRLWLRYCKSITAKGMGNFFGILQSTSIDGTMNANHSLESFYDSSWREEGLREPEFRKLLSNELMFCLQSNEIRNKNAAARRKIFHRTLPNNNEGN